MQKTKIISVIIIGLFINSISMSAISVQKIQIGDKWVYDSNGQKFNESATDLFVIDNVQIANITTDRPFVDIISTNGASVNGTYFNIEFYYGNIQYVTQTGMIPMFPNNINVSISFAYISNDTLISKSFSIADEFPSRSISFDPSKSIATDEATTYQAILTSSHNSLAFNKLISSLEGGGNFTVQTEHFDMTLRNSTTDEMYSYNGFVDTFTYIDTNHTIHTLENNKSLSLSQTKDDPTYKFSYNTVDKQPYFIEQTERVKTVNTLTLQSNVIKQKYYLDGIDESTSKKSSLTFIIPIFFGTAIMVILMRKLFNLTN